MNPYNHAILNIKINLDIKEIGNKLKENILIKIIKLVENRCIEDGIVKVSSVKSFRIRRCGERRQDLIYVVFECMVCNPTEAMILEAKVMTITKAGIHAVVEDDEETLQSRFSWRETTTKATSSSTTSPRERRSPSSSARF
jgi:DNA-directed RNA polymerase subunit E'/Rpb7